MSKPRAATKPPSSRGGRPLKGDEPVERVLAVRMGEADFDLLAAIVAHESARIEAEGGMVSRVTNADVVRALIRQEAERRKVKPKAKTAR